MKTILRPKKLNGTKYKNRTNYAPVNNRNANGRGRQVWKAVPELVIYDVLEWVESLRNEKAWYTTKYMTAENRAGFQEESTTGEKGPKTENCGERHVNRTSIGVPCHNNNNSLLVGLKNRILDDILKNNRLQFSPE